MSSAARRPTTDAVGKIRTNRDQLVKISAIGEVTTAWFLPHTSWFISNEGVPRVVPNCGGVTYNVRVGQALRDIVGDHVEPAVSIGIICHGDSTLSGHGPGVTGLLASRSGAIEPVIDANANIGAILGLT